MSDLWHKDVPDEFIDRVFAVMAYCPQHQFLILTKRAERMLHYFRSEPQERILAEYGKIEYPRGSEVYVDIWSEHDNWLYDFAEGCWPLPNVILGVSVSTQKDADRSIPLLLQTPAAMRIVSIEPMLEYTNIIPYIGGRSYHCDCGWHETENEKLFLAGRDATCLDCGKECSIYPTLDAVICGCESGSKRRPFNEDWARRLRDECQAAGVPFYFKQSIQGGKLVKEPFLDGVQHLELPWVKPEEVTR
jgi:protein gp37